VSKKTIPFTMPAGRRQERAPVVLDGLTGESVPFAGDEQDLRDAQSDPRSDEWVRDSAPGAEPPSRALAFGASITVDLSAERSLAEAMTLSFALPFALGWFWWANAVARRQRMWGG